MNSHLTSTNPQLERLISATPQGMAHWSGTGPKATTCGQCIFWGYYFNKEHFPGRCEKFFRMTDKHGKKPLTYNQASCRHFERKGK